MRDARVRGSQFAWALLAGLTAAVLGGVGTAEALDTQLGGEYRLKNNLVGQVYGRINPVAVVGDNGEQSGFAVGDSGAYPSFLGFKVRTMDGYGPGYAWGAKVEFGLGANSLENFNLTDFGSGSSDGAKVRRADTWVKLPVAKFKGGYGPGVARFVTMEDNSGTSLIHAMDARDVWSIPVTLDNGTATTLFLQDSFAKYDGDRGPRVAVYSNRYGGVKGGISYADQDEIEYYINYAMYRDEGYSHEEAEEEAYWDWYWGVDDLDFSVGYIRNIGDQFAFDESKSRLGASVSILFSNGFNVTAAYGRRDSRNPSLPDASSTYVKVGKKWGNHAMTLDWNQTIGADESSYGKTQGARYGVAYVLQSGHYQLGAGVENYTTEFNDSAAPDTNDVQVYKMTLAVSF